MTTTATKKKTTTPAEGQSFADQGSLTPPAPPPDPVAGILQQLAGELGMTFGLSINDFYVSPEPVAPGGAPRLNAMAICRTGGELPLIDVQASIQDELLRRTEQLARQGVEQARLAEQRTKLEQARETLRIAEEEITTATAERLSVDVLDERAGERFAAAAKREADARRRAAQATELIRELPGRIASAEGSIRDRISTAAHTEAASIGERVRALRQQLATETAQALTPLLHRLLAITAAGQVLVDLPAVARAVGGMADLSTEAPAT